MTDKGDNGGNGGDAGDGGNDESELSKRVTTDSKARAEGGKVEKGKTGDETSGETGGYGFTRPSAESADSDGDSE